MDVVGKEVKWTIEACCMVVIHEKTFGLQMVQSKYACGAISKLINAGLILNLNFWVFEFLDFGFPIPNYGFVIVESPNSDCMLLGEAKNE